jgi:ketosteroid isomerase-like protein
MKQLIKKWLEVTANGPAEAWRELAAEGIVLRLPFAPPGVAKELSGVDQAVAAMNILWAAKKSFVWHEVVIRATEDAGLFVSTARSEVLLLSGPYYANSYIMLTRLQHEKVIEHVEYFNPLPVIEVFGSQTQNA